MNNAIRLLFQITPLVLLAACSSTSLPPEGKTTRASSYKPGVPGGTVVETRTMIANVTDIDSDRRLLSLVNSEGKRATVKCGAEVINFDQIRLNDRVKVQVTEEVVIKMAGPGSPADDGTAAAVLLAPRGANPGGILVGTAQVTGTVVAIDRRNRTATLQFADRSTKTYHVRDDVDLGARKVGEQVIFRATEMLAIKVEKP
jgi:hypothetical protein